MATRGMFIAALLGGFLVCLAFNHVEAAATPKDLKSYFKACKPRTPEFDACMNKTLNKVTFMFPKGAPAYGIKSLDPIWVKEVNTTRGSPLISLKVRLLNVTETNWTNAQFTYFKSNLDQYAIQYQQLFPEKSCFGDYELSVSLLGLPVKRTGKFFFKYWDYVMTTTVQAPPMMKNGQPTGEYGPIKARAVFNQVKNLTLQFTNLGRTPELDKLLNNLINVSSKQVWMAITPVMDDLISQGVTTILNENFAHFPFNTFFK